MHNKSCICENSLSWGDQTLGTEFSIAIRSNRPISTDSPQPICAAIFLGLLSVWLVTQAGLGGPDEEELTPLLKNDIGMDVYTKRPHPGRSLLCVLVSSAGTQTSLSHSPPHDDPSVFGVSCCVSASHGNLPRILKACCVSMLRSAMTKRLATPGL